MTIPLLDVQARWGYTEIVDSNHSQRYNGGYNIDALREKRRARVPFEDLSEAERYYLAFLCACDRANLFVYFVGIERFRLVTLSRAELGDLFVPPNVWGDSQGQFYRFSHYINTPAARNEMLAFVGPTAEGYQPAIDPVTVGQSYNHLILLDGYHRAAVFWRFGPPDGALSAYVPA